MSIDPAMAAACGPLSRTTPMPAGAGAVASATMVSVGENTGSSAIVHRWRGLGPAYFRAAMITVFMNASPMLSDVTSDRSVTAMCTIRRS